MSLKQRCAVYANAGAELIHFDMDVDACTLTRRGSLKMPSFVQYAWPHASKPVIYAATSSRVSRHDLGTEHYVCAVKIGDKGELSMHGKPALLPGRPVHISTDIGSRNILVALNRPENRLLVFRIEADGTVGQEVKQRADLDAGFFPHQIRVTPDNRFAIAVTRGNPGANAAEDRQKDPGALKVFEYRDGLLGRQVDVNGGVDGGDGYRFGVRHLDFHPTEPWIFVSNETQNKLHVHKRLGDEIENRPSYTRETLLDPGKTGRAQRQCAGAIHFHPDGKVVYGVNRGVIPQASEGKDTLVDPDNTLAVYSVNEATGEPKLIQHIDSEGLSPRTFALDPSGRMLVAGNSEAFKSKKKASDPAQLVPCNLAVFKVLEDGRLAYQRKYDVEVAPKQSLFWMGIVSY